MVGLPWLDGISSIIVPTPWGSLLSASHEPRGTTAASARLQPHKQPTTHDEWSAPDCVQYNCGVQGPVLWQQTNNPVSKQTKQRSYRMSQRNLTPAGLSQSAQCYHRVWGEKMVLTTKWDKKKIGLLWQETLCICNDIHINKYLVHLWFVYDVSNDQNIMVLKLPKWIMRIINLTLISTWEYRRCAICLDSLEILRTGCVAPRQLILKVALSTMWANSKTNLRM